MKVGTLVYNRRNRHILEFVLEAFRNQAIFNLYQLRFECCTDTNFQLINSFSDGFFIFVGEIFYSL